MGCKQCSNTSNSNQNEIVAQRAIENGESTLGNCTVPGEGQCEKVPVSRSDQQKTEQPSTRTLTSTSSTGKRSNIDVVENYLQGVYHKVEIEQLQSNGSQPLTLPSSNLGSQKQNSTSSHKKISATNIRFRRDSFIQMTQQNVNTRYIFQTKLGQGAYGCVFKCQDRTRKLPRAIKIIKKRNLKTTSTLFSELNILRTLDHPNIIKLYDVHDNKDFFYVVTEHCAGGELFQAVRGAERITEKNLASIMKQILSAVNYMHRKGIVHRDLKPENIVLEYRAAKGSMKEPPIKIIDFGTATEFKQGVYLTEKVGSPYYVAPDVLDLKYNEKCDLWSCGVMLYTLLSGSPPFKGRTINEIFDNIRRQTPMYQEGIWPRISSQAIDLVKALLTKDPNRRISAQQALNHKWISQCSDSSSTTIDQSVLKNLQQFYFKNKFIAVIQTYLATNAVSQQDRRILAEQFRQIDKDNSGAIQTAELLLAFKKIYGEKYPQQAISEIINNIDSNGSGKIDFTEFIVAIQEREKLFQRNSLESAFNFFDKVEQVKVMQDKTGFLEVSELKALLGHSTEEEVQQIIDCLDENRDRKISKEEFMGKMMNRSC